MGSTPSTFRLEVTHADEGRRLDVWLEHAIPQLSRTRLKSLIASGHVQLDRRPPKPHTKVVAGDQITVTVPPVDPTPTALPEAIPLDVLLEDDDILIINKPAGRVVHPAAGHETGTIVNAVLHHCTDLQGIGGEMRPGIVHRLDQDTTGALVVAKHDAALDALQQQFKSGSVEKRYLAIVRGIPTPVRKRIESDIGRHPVHRKKMSVLAEGGRNAVTHYEIRESFPGTDASLLEVRIETGRTHQIRVHMTHEGHPILGDATYGRARTAQQAPRQMLHAWRLAIAHPRSGAPLSIEAPIPDDMNALLARLRGTT